MGHQRQNQNQLYLFITKESPTYMYWFIIFISHKSNILQTENTNSIRHTFATKFTDQVFK